MDAQLHEEGHLEGDPVKHRLAVWVRVLMVFMLIIWARPSIYSASALAGGATLGGSKSARSMGEMMATSLSAVADVLHQVPERFGLVLLGVALLGSAALLRRKWKVIRPS